MLSQKKTNCNPLACPTWKCHHTNLWIAKLFHMTEGLLRSFKRWRLWREPVVGCRQWLWKELVVMRGIWNVRQTMSQQVFRMTVFCTNTCFQSFSTLISHVVHHAVPKFSPRCNKPLPQASTCPSIHALLAITVTNISQTFYLQDGGKINWHRYLRYGTKLLQSHLKQWLSSLYACIFLQSWITFDRHVTFNQLCCKRIAQ